MIYMYYDDGDEGKQTEEMPKKFGGTASDDIKSFSLSKDDVPVLQFNTKGECVSRGQQANLGFSLKITVCLS